VLNANVGKMRTQTTILYPLGLMLETQDQEHCETVTLLIHR